MMDMGSAEIFMSLPLLGITQLQNLDGSFRTAARSNLYCAAPGAAENDEATSLTSITDRLVVVTASGPVGWNKHAILARTLLRIGNQMNFLHFSNLADDDPVCTLALENSA